MDLFANLNLNYKFKIMRDRNVMLKEVFSCTMPNFLEWSKQYSLIGNRYLSEFKISNDTIIMNNDELRSLYDSIAKHKLTNSIFNLF